MYDAFDVLLINFPRDAESVVEGVSLVVPVLVCDALLCIPDYHTVCLPTHILGLQLHFYASARTPHQLIERIHSAMLTVPVMLSSI